MSLLEARDLTVSVALAGERVPVSTASRFALGAGQGARPGRRVRRRQVDDRPHHRAIAAARISRSHGGSLAFAGEDLVAHAAGKAPRAARARDRLHSAGAADARSIRC